MKKKNLNIETDLGVFEVSIQKKGTFSGSVYFLNSFLITKLKYCGLLIYGIAAIIPHNVCTQGGLVVRALIITS